MPTDLDVKIQELITELVDATPALEPFDRLYEIGARIANRPVAAGQARHALRPFLVNRPRVIFLAIATVIGALAIALTVRTSGPSNAAILQQIANAPRAALAAGTVHRETTDQWNFSGDVAATTLTRFSEEWAGGSTIRGDSYEETYRTQDGFFVTVIQSGPTAYVRYADAAATPIQSPGWFSYQVRPIAKPTPIPPRSPANVLGVTGPITRLGASTIGGTAVTGYTVTISLKSAIAESKTTSSRYFYQSILYNYGATTFPEQIWLDKLGRFKELRLSIHGPFKDETQSVTQLYSYTATPFTVEAPASSDITAVASEVQAFADANQHPVANR